jgi:hypothetical protein
MRKVQTYSVLLLEVLPRCTKRCSRTGNVMVPRCTWPLTLSSGRLYTWATIWTWWRWPVIVAEKSMIALVNDGKFNPFDAVAIHFSCNGFIGLEKNGFVGFEDW